MPFYEKPAINIPLRVTIALGLTLTCFCILGLRLWFLQILRGEYFRDRSENNRLRQVYIPPPRGLIKDRYGSVLVKNRPSFNIELVTEDSPDPVATLKLLAPIVEHEAEELISALRDQRRRPPFEAKLILKDVLRDVVARVLARRYDLPGIVVSVIPARDYIYGSLAAHVFGYIREISKAQLDSPRYPGYRMGDLVGQYGIEGRWEKYLHGQRGVQAVVVNANGTRIGESSFERERSGHNITLTLDLDVQRAADEALKGQRGAIVAMDPHTGEILALASSPAFDPNIFTAGISADAWEDLISGEDHKLNNRAVQGGYPPGSVFKIFMAVAAHSEGVMAKREHVLCPGSLLVGNRRFRCHKKAGHGVVDHHDALVQSCDVYFYTVGNRLGIDRIHDYATRFGLGRVTGLELSEENPGLIPSTTWKRTHFKRREDQKWYPGETPSVSIGQGAVVVTPLQITRAVAALVNGGYLMKPYLVRRIEAGDVGSHFVDDDFTPEIQDKLNVDDAILKLVRDDLVGVVNEVRGTGRRASLMNEFGIEVGGKTGTAQVMGYDSLPTDGGGVPNDHAWFAGFAPAHEPQIVVTALVEHGGHGGVTAAPLVKSVMTAFFEKRKAREEGS